MTAASTGSQQAPITLTNSIPLPPRDRSGPRKGKYPWDEMTVGSSFHEEGVKNLVPPKRLRDAGWEFATRKEGEGIRIWRTA